MNGGLALVEAAQWAVPISEKTQTQLQIASMFVALAVYLVWAYALLKFLVPEA